MGAEKMQKKFREGHASKLARLAFFPRPPFVLILGLLGVMNSYMTRGKVNGNIFSLSGKGMPPTGGGELREGGRMGGT